VEYLWWQRGIIYQVYVRSFQDSDGDGLGDLTGVIDRLDYLAWLGVDALWLTPFYPSPQVDTGYDVANYTDVDPVYGSLDVFDRLLAEAHRQNLRVIVDLVPNHTSDRHPWFVDARGSRDAAHRDWYVWLDPAPGGGPPNNWLSEFAGSAWQLDPAHASTTSTPSLSSSLT
jgi:alpha-glucosidase